MANTNSQHQRASMDDILSSIRRIIDESGPADGADLRAQPPAMPLRGGIVNEPAVMADAPFPDAQTVVEVQPDVPAAPTQYSERFTADDAEAFREVAQVLQSTASILHARDNDDIAVDGPSDPSPMVTNAKDAVPLEAMVPAFVNGAQSDAAAPKPTSDRAESTPAQAMAERVVPLISDTASRSIAQTLAALDDMLTDRTGQDLKETTEELLKPMLAEWLDENLPSMVERLVRQEIERIARGEPRAA